MHELADIHPDFGAATAKRQFAYSNSSVVRRIDKGKLHVTRKVEKKVVTAVRYQNSSGKWCWQGTAALKSTENLVYIVH